MKSKGNHEDLNYISCSRILSLPRMNRNDPNHRHEPVPRKCNNILYTKVDYSHSAKIRSRDVPRDVRREGYKGLLHRGLYTIFFTTTYVKTLSNNKKLKFVTQSRIGLQIYEGHDDQLNRQGPMG
jgi:hypothetical protein